MRTHRSSRPSRPLQDVLLRPELDGKALHRLLLLQVGDHLPVKDSGAYRLTVTGFDTHGAVSSETSRTIIVDAKKAVQGSPKQAAPAAKKRPFEVVIDPNLRNGDHVASCYFVLNPDIATLPFRFPRSLRKRRTCRSRIPTRTTPMPPIRSR